DFELSFSFLLEIAVGPRKQPWEVANLNIGGKHLFYQELHGLTIQWQPILEALSRLTDTRLLQLQQSLPVEWQPWAQRACTHLAAVRDHPTEFALELERSLV